MINTISKFTGANIDLCSQSEIDWKQGICPWNNEEDNNKHKCAVKNQSICKYFCGIEYLDTIMCCYSNENPY